MQVLDEFGVMVIMSAIRFVMSVVAALLSRRCGRRPMMMVSGLGMAACSIAAGAALVTGSDPVQQGTTSALINATVSNATTAAPSILGGEAFAASWPPLVFVLLFVMFSSIGYAPHYPIVLNHLIKLDCYITMQNMEKYNFDKNVKSIVFKNY